MYIDELIGQLQWLKQYYGNIQVEHAFKWKIGEGYHSKEIQVVDYVEEKKKVVLM